MDGLALLCNLFADGPVTLRRLRAAGLGHLSDLERLETARLAATLHASEPQARAFAEEARKLVRRLAEEGPRTPRPAAREGAATATPAPPPAPARVPVPAAEPARDPGETLLAPGLLPGLDEALVARLVRVQVRTLRALGEFAGLTLARRTGIPYATLLELSRTARRHVQERRRAATPAERPPAQRLGEGVLLPFLPEPRRAPSEVELAPTESYHAPEHEPGAAGPFV